MQLVGVDCYVCKNRIRLAPDAGACATCDIAFHTACLAQPDLCPVCAGNFVEAEIVRSVNKEKKRIDDATGGRKIIVVSGAVLLGSQVLVSTAVWFSSGIEQAVLEFVRLIALGVAFVMLLSGFGWARTWVAIGLGVATVVSVGITMASFGRGDAPQGIISGAFMSLYGTLFAYIAFSQRITTYIDAQKKHRSPDYK